MIPIMPKKSLIARIGKRITLSNSLKEEHTISQKSINDQKINDELPSKIELISHER